MQSLPRIVYFYIFLLFLLALLALTFSVIADGTGFAWWISVVLVAIGIALLDLNPVTLFGEKIEVTLSDTIKFASVLLFPTTVVVSGTFFGTLFSESFSKRKLSRRLFNIAQMTLCMVGSSIIFRMIYQPAEGYFGTIPNGAAVLLAAAIQFLINMLLVAMAISLSTKTPILSVWIQNIQNIVWYELSLYPFGVILAILWQYNPLSIALTSVIFLVIRQSYHVAVQLQQQTQDALRALVQVIDVRDHHTLDHSERVSRNAKIIAEDLKLPPEEIEIIASAALLHDLGKVGMADDILFSPKRLNPEEQSHAKQHAEVGAMLLSKFPLFAKGANLVKYHHERFDGRGYPEGLIGYNIPLGARIISVADSYEAMIEERLYRHAFTTEQAIAELTKGSGTQFDPVVVKSFVRLLQTDEHSGTGT